MTKKSRKGPRLLADVTPILVIVLMSVLGGTSSAQAAEAEAKGLLKAMSEYLAAQKTISFGYDANFEVVTKDHQKLLLADSGTLDLSQPDKIRATRSAGFVNVEMVFDGNALTVLDKDANAYVQVDAPGTIEHVIDELREKFHKPLPGADLLLPNAYDALMADVTDVKDLGSGVIGGTECDHLAFRTKDLDWQIWIAQGKRPYPCRYVITSKQVDQAPQYSIQIRDWKAGDEVAPADFSFKAPADAKRMDVRDLKNMKFGDELPSNFTVGDAK
jgi:hypothetical protein